MGVAIFVPESPPPVVFEKTGRPSGTAQCVVVCTKHAHNKCRPAHARTHTNKTTDMRTHTHTHTHTHAQHGTRAYVNSKTGQELQEARAATGDVYYYDHATGESQWEKVGRGVGVGVIVCVQQRVCGSVLSRLQRFK